MKILILSDDFPPQVLGGAGMIAYRLSREFLRQGHHVRIVTTVRSRSLEGMYEIDGMQVHRIYSDYHERWRAYVSLWNPSALGKIKKILKEFKPDVVHVHNVHSYLSYASLRTARKYTRKVFMTAHDIMPFYPGTFTEFIDPQDVSVPHTFNYRVTTRMLMKKFRLRFNPLRNRSIRKYVQEIGGVICVSNALKDALSQNGVRVKGVIHNGIDMSDWDISPESAESFKNSVHIQNKDAVLFGGRLSGAKGGELILRAMQTVIAAHPRAVLLVAGRKDAYAQRMEKRAEELGIAPHVVFAGWLSENDMKRAYASALVVAIPSVCFDSFPNGNLEAFAAKKPVVSTCFGGSAEIVRHGENGYIVNPFDTASLADSISNLLKNPELAGRLGRSGNELIAQEYAIAAVAHKYLLLFSE